MSIFFVSQLLTGLALCTDILSFQMRKRAHILICFILSCSLLSIHFICLHHWTAAALALFACIRFIISFLSNKKRYAALCLVGVILLTALTWEGPLSLLAAAAATAGTIAAFSNQDQQLRKRMFFSTTFWIIHNTLAGSPGAVLVESVFLLSNAVGYFRYYILPKKQILHKKK